MAWCLFAEVPGWLQLLGGAFVLTGVLYYSYLESKKDG
jgi:drug/metabolite transporter (DMT)-like permease